VEREVSEERERCLELEERLREREGEYVNDLSEQETKRKALEIRVKDMEALQRREGMEKKALEDRAHELERECAALREHSNRASMMGMEKEEVGIQTYETGLRLVDIDERVVALKAYVDTLLESSMVGRRETHQTWRIKAPRDTIVKQLLDRVAKWGLLPGYILKKHRIIFDNEEGMDNGGLSRDLYSEFFSQLLSPKEKEGERRLFVCADGCSDGCYLPNHMLEKSKDIEEQFEGVGKIIMRCVIHEYAFIHPQLRLLVYFLRTSSPPVDLPQALAFFDLYDRDHANSLRNLLQESDSQYNMSELFTVIPPSLDPSAALTDSNKRGVVLCHICYILYDRIEWQLSAILRGFNSVNLRAHLNLFSEEELADYLCGHRCTSDDLVECIEFDMNNAAYHNDVVATNFRTWISRLSLEDCTVLLRCMTGLSLIPTRGLRRKLRVRMVDSSQYPSVSTCYFRIDLPSDEDYGTMGNKLAMLMAQEKASKGFTAK